MRLGMSLLVVGLLCAMTGPATAHWDPGQPAKWVQEPDLSYDGLDVNATAPYILADDFPCEVTGPITDISEKGMAIELEHILPDGLTIKLAIENPVTSPIVTGARVVWSKKLAGKKPGYAMGMVFRYMREKHRRNLDRLIEFLDTIPE